MSEHPASSMTRTDGKKPLPVIATVFLLLAVIMSGFMLSMSNETPTTIGDGIGLGAAIVAEAIMISGLVLSCSIFSIISICMKQWRAWSCVMLVLCFTWFACFAWQIITTD